MFLAKLVASLALVAPLVSALTIDTPTNWTSSDPASLSWTAQIGDPQTFSIELANERFNRQFALANNVPTGQMTIRLALPVVPVGDGYTIQFVNIGNLGDVYAESGPFSIGASVSSSSSMSSALSSASASATASAPSASLTSASSTSGFGTTRSATGTGSGLSSGAAATGTSFDNGAVALGISNVNVASFAVMVLAALGGARLVGF